ncbi:ribbon-helix-helix domain-containing protein [Marvinbryantia sp.]|uniref:ribbon-helix-helix domain-containing protein n=1 Tax=Marvinbryantia sp. TaxID=2496532 RepID=UPI0025E1A9F3|nr:ribbon-helix-helix domain-containing protein [uncultured Marvinbryantia sp.]
MSPRKGRPKVDEPKDIRFSIRIDDDTNKKLDDYCEKNGITKAEAIRKGIHLLLSQKE